ncbi:Uma2 family endonuclease [Thermus igniterrae]|uniref:Uma2 family endonuclease n=1 Tax=Thermus igniterrae TaxID=88189 RepID=UPI000376679B|nr:Uma2 family endonuclease [Thermus igniterrae]
MAEPAEVLHPLPLSRYLEEEAQSPVRRELVRGFPRAMAGASRQHNLLVTALGAALFPLALARGCRVHAETFKLKVAPDTVYYPDLMVVCAPPGQNPSYEENPCLVIEVLSPSTEAQDRWEKMRAYLGLASLQGYLLLDPERKGLEGYFREGEGFSWRRFTQGLVPLPCLGGTLDLEEVYAGLA